MLKKLTLGISLIFVAFNISGLQAQETKIGLVNPQIIINAMPEYAAAELRLQNFRNKELQKLEEQGRLLEQAIEIYEQKIEVISASARQAEQIKLSKMDSTFQQSQRLAQDAIQRRSQELYAPLQEQIGASINQVAQEMGLSYVMNTRTSNNDATVLYVSNEYARKFNITNAVMNKLGIN
jgi:outer membrane protein